MDTTKLHLTLRKTAFWSSTVTFGLLALGMLAGIQGMGSLLAYIALPAFVLMFVSILTICAMLAPEKYAYLGKIALYAGLGAFILVVLGIFAPMMIMQSPFIGQVALVALIATSTAAYFGILFSTEDQAADSVKNKLIKIMILLGLITTSIGVINIFTFNPMMLMGGRGGLMGDTNALSYVSAFITPISTIVFFLFLGMHYLKAKQIDEIFKNGSALSRMLGLGSIASGAIFGIIGILLVFNALGFGAMEYYALSAVSVILLTVAFIASALEERFPLQAKLIIYTNLVCLVLAFLGFFGLLGGSSLLSIPFVLCAHTPFVLVMLLSKSKTENCTRNQFIMYVIWGVWALGGLISLLIIGQVMSIGIGQFLGIAYCALFWIMIVVFLMVRSNTTTIKDAINPAKPDISEI